MHTFFCGKPCDNLSICLSIYICQSIDGSNNISLYLGGVYAVDRPDHEARILDRLPVSGSRTRWTHLGWVRRSHRIDRQIDRQKWQQFNVLLMSSLYLKLGVKHWQPFIDVVLYFRFVVNHIEMTTINSIINVVFIFEVCR